jgi:hypothetical protein
VCFWTLSIAIILFKTQRIRDWISSPSSGKILLNWCQSIEQIPVSGDKHLLYRLGKQYFANNANYEASRGVILSILMLCRMYVCIRGGPEIRPLHRDHQ